MITLEIKEIAKRQAIKDPPSNNNLMQILKYKT